MLTATKPYDGLEISEAERANDRPTDGDRGTDRQPLSGTWDVPEETYFSNVTAVSHSQLEVFRKWRPNYYAEFILKTLRREPTDPMRTGSATHCLTLEPDAFDDRFAVAPKCDRRTNVGKAAWAEFLIKNAAKSILDAEQYEAARGMSSALKSNREFMFLLSNATNIEQPYRWQQPLVEGGHVACKCKPDIVVSNGFIVDIKSASDVAPDAWLRSAANFGYHRQAAFYVDGLYAIDGVPRQFCHVVVGNYEPFPVVLYCLGGDSLDLGRTENTVDLYELVGCRLSGDWRDPAEKQIQHVNLPRWAFTKGYAA